MQINVTPNSKPRKFKLHYLIMWWFSDLFMLVSFWSQDCSAVLLFPERSRPPEPVYVNSLPSSWIKTESQVNGGRERVLEGQFWVRITNVPRHLRSLRREPESKRRRYFCRESQRREACECRIHSPEHHKHNKIIHIQHVSTVQDSEQKQGSQWIEFFSPMITGLFHFIIFLTNELFGGKKLSNFYCFKNISISKNVSLCKL